MYTPEEIFIKDLEDYFFSGTKLREIDIKKIKILLFNYKQKSNVEVKIVTKNFVVYKNANSYQVAPESNKKLLPINGLKEEFEVFCNDRNVKYSNVKKNGRSTKEIAKIRSEFCNYVAENFLVSKSELATFFGLNHATIHYYFNEKAKEK